MLTREKLLHPATIIATIALIVALSGASYAATKVGTGGLKNKAVTRAKIANNAVTGPKIATGAVAARDLARGSVSAGKLASGAVTTPALANGSVAAGKLAANAVTAAALANGSVTTDKLGPNAVTGAKIAGSTITAANIQNGQVVKGNGSLVSGRLALAPGAGNSLLLSLPGIATVQVSCQGSVGSTTVTNLSGSTLTASVAAFTPGGTPVIRRSAVLPGGADILANDAIAQSATWQLSYTGADNVAHVATVTIAESIAADPAIGCVWSGQALTTG
jgi:hypothetical protein